MRIMFNVKSHGIEVARAAGIEFYDSVAHTVISIVDDNDKLLSGVIYSDYNLASINMHVAVFDQRGVNRDMLWVCFDYPFNQLKVNWVFGFIRTDNLKAQEFAYKLGYEYCTVIPGVFTDANQLVLRMGPAHCRWLKHKPRLLEANYSGWEKSSSAAAA